ncbi:MAG: hypothetical protein ACO3K7_00585 [Candidatus Marinamargulisbacteria bacterium]
MTPSESFASIESTIQTQINDLCQTYTVAINQLLPVLKKALNTLSNQKDQKIVTELLNEGTDHLDNLIQLNNELKGIKDTNRGSLLEISSEVLANAGNYLNTAPKKAGNLSLFPTQRNRIN